MIENLIEDEVIIIDSHDDIFKDYRVYYWRKDRISDILPAIKCPSFKSETKIFRYSEMYKIGKLIKDKSHAKSIVIKNTDEELSINLVYGDTIKITPWTSSSIALTNLLGKLKERRKLWKIKDWKWKPKKIRALAWDFDNLENLIDKVK